MRVRTRQATAFPAIFLVLLFVVFLSFFLAWATRAAAQGPYLPFVVEPTTASEAPLGYFVIRAQPGDHVTDSITVRNVSSEGITVRLMAVDATSGVYGGVSYGLPTDPVKQVGKWISLSRDTVQLPPQSAREVTFTVDIPAGTTSGDHLAGIAVWVPREAGGDTEPPAEGRLGARVTQQTRRVIAVQVVTPGPANPELVVTGVKPVVRPDGLYLEIGIRNQGHGLTKGMGRIELLGESFSKSFALDTVVPGTEVDYPIKWMETSAPAEKAYNARVRIDYAGRTVEWTGSFRVGNELVEQLSKWQVTPVEHANQGLPLLPLVAVVVGGAFLVLLLLLGIRRLSR